jgi:hypothetical protein
MEKSKPAHQLSSAQPASSSLPHSAAQFSGPVRDLPPSRSGPSRTGLLPRNGPALPAHRSTRDAPTTVTWAPHARSSPPPAPRARAGPPVSSTPRQRPRPAPAHRSPRANAPLAPPLIAPGPCVRRSLTRAARRPPLTDCPDPPGQVHLSRLSRPRNRTLRSPPRCSPAFPTGHTHLGSPRRLINAARGLPEPYLPQ